MKLSSFMRMNTCSTVPISSIIYPKSTLSPKLRRPISSSSISTSPNPRKPLFLRPPTYQTTLADLKKFQNWAKTLSISVGPTFVTSDNGPDTNLLLRELKWLLEDTVVDNNSLISQMGNLKNNTFKDSSLENDIFEDNSIISQKGDLKNDSYEDNFIIAKKGNLKNDRPIGLRISLDELYGLWKQRIEERRPFQYIVGSEHWRDLVLSVQEGVLIPRPETEKVVDLVSDLVKEKEEMGEGMWADLGTGSGAIAIGIGRVLGSGGKVFATDLSPVAVAVASYNVQRYGLQDKIEIRQGSWFEPLRDIGEKLSGIVSNPPYIPSEDIPGLQAEVGRHEPKLALDGGINGLDDLLHLCDGAASMLKPGGYFIFETNGEKQCKFLKDYLENDSEGSFCDVRIISDFANIPRFVTGFHH